MGAREEGSRERLSFSQEAHNYSTLDRKRKRKERENEGEQKELCHQHLLPPPPSHVCLVSGDNSDASAVEN